MSVSNAQVWEALSTVRDPELDEPITDLKFVTEAKPEGDGVRVRLRLPTYFCAPNFAYLMVADSRDVLMELPGVSSVDIRLEDHFASEQINEGVAEQAGFTGSFPEQARGELDELRMTFRRKAYLASLDRLAMRLVKDGREPVNMTLGELPDCAERTALLRRRRDLGFSSAADQPLLADEHGEPMPENEVPLRLRFARSVRVSIEGNGIFCRGLLKTRYPETEEAVGAAAIKKAS